MEGGVLELGGEAHGGGRLRAFGFVVGALVAGVLLGLLMIELFPPGGRGEAVVSREMPEASAMELPRIAAGRAGGEAPLVVIDAGHGGFDPGAVGPSGAVEKNVALSIALALRDRLLELGAVRVALTREDDRFLPLEERVSLAEALQPDLFLSIHADSAPVEEARGGNVYTLSSRASDVEAMALAQDVNASDGETGLPEAEMDEVEAILAELARREIALGSAQIADRMEGAVRGAMPVHGKFRRSANLVVLRSVRMPSLLFEAGYISNEDDAARVTSEEGRAAIVNALADAITAGLLAPGR